MSHRVSNKESITNTVSRCNAICGYIENIGKLENIVQCRPADVFVMGFGVKLCLVGKLRRSTIIASSGFGLQYQCFCKEIFFKKQQLKILVAAELKDALPTPVSLLVSSTELHCIY